MKVGILKEIKTEENRVCMTPAGVEIMKMNGHDMLLDMNLDRLRYLSDVMPANCFTLMSSPATIRKLVKEADVVVGAVLIPGAKAPRLVTREMLSTMKKGSVLVDVAIDQGGCFETSKATTHGKPTYVVDGAIHYCVANMPGAVAKTSTLALNASIPATVCGTAANHRVRRISMASRFSGEESATLYSPQQAPQETFGFTWHR